MVLLCAPEGFDGSETEPLRVQSLIFIRRILGSTHLQWCLLQQFREVHTSHRLHRFGSLCLVKSRIVSIFYQVNFSPWALQLELGLGFLAFPPKCLPWEPLAGHCSLTRLIFPTLLQSFFKHHLLQS